MDILKYKTKTYHGPASWTDCSPEMVAKLIAFSRVPVKDVTDNVYEMAVQIVFSIPEKAWAQWIMNRAEWEMLKEQIRWVFTPPQDRKSVV